MSWGRGIEALKDALGVSSPILLGLLQCPGTDPCSIPSTDGAVQHRTGLLAQPHRNRPKKALPDSRQELCFLGTGKYQSLPNSAHCVAKEIL